MYRASAALIICILLAPWPASAVTIPTVLVGDLGNRADTTVMIDGTTGYGTVAYDYRIGTYEVTNEQYAEFLNAKAAADPLSLYHENMTFDAFGGIARSGSPGGYSYAVKSNMGNKPVNYVGWYDAIRFVNWLHNGQGDGDTETGAYTILGGTITPSNGNEIARNPNARWFMPNENEWYKAAYYQPAAQGGDVDDYWLYPTRSNSVPTAATVNSVGDISNPGSNVVNYSPFVLGKSGTGNPTTVGSAGPLSQSFYGTSDQAGNVSEWNETLIGAASRGMRGTSYNLPEWSMQSTFRDSNPFPRSGGPQFGFRVATIVPEPSTLALAALGFLGLLIAARRRR